MTRGKLNLEGHKLAGLYRPPAERMRWKRARRERCPDEAYRQLWQLVRGAVRDTFANHPEYLTDAGRMAAERSIVKRVTGTLHGYATQVARGRSIGGQGTARDLAAEGPKPLLTGGGHASRFFSGPVRMVRLAMAHLGMAARPSQKFSGDHDG